MLYRPYDIRWTLYTGNARGFICNPRRPVQQYMISNNNLALIANRQVNNDFRHIIAARTLIDTCTLSSATRETSYIFPLYLTNNSELKISSTAELNFSVAFLEAFSKAILQKEIKNGLPDGISAEMVFFYIYAVFSSNTYRIRYAEFLKIDFPRLPLTSSLDLFRALSKLGGELVALHLMESPKLDQHLTTYTGSAAPVVDKVSWANNTVWLDRAQKSGFIGVPENVWNFHIGGYQVCHKWLKDRKGRTLTAEDLNHYHRIVVALSETIRLMAEIDEVIEQFGGWPRAFSIMTEESF